MVLIEQCKFLFIQSYNSTDSLLSAWTAGYQGLVHDDSSSSRVWYSFSCDFEG